MDLKLHGELVNYPDATGLDLDFTVEIIESQKFIFVPPPQKPEKEKEQEPEPEPDAEEPDNNLVQV